ncbi:MAG: AbrB/MazE/SpoVT family DNA-binding domain-containing protein [Blastocatellia bacterium]|nr:AbrB/MazE/SpoVT family DNA-binding domain-containing protein [Blastocatellia bacterium]
MARTLLKVKRWAQITLPAEIRRELKLSEGDYLEVERVEGGVLLKPVHIEQLEQDTLSLEEWEKLQADIAEGATVWAERDKEIAEEYLPLEEELWSKL